MKLPANNYLVLFTLKRRHDPTQEFQEAHSPVHNAMGYKSEIRFCPKSMQGFNIIAGFAMPISLVAQMIQVPQVLNVIRRFYASTVEYLTEQSNTLPSDVLPLSDLTWYQR